MKALKSLDKDPEELSAIPELEEDIEKVISR